jgi:hypothetical protein
MTILPTTMLPDSSRIVIRVFITGIGLVTPQFAVTEILRRQTLS